jgi:hypothetical protein
MTLLLILSRPGGVRVALVPILLSHSVRSIDRFCFEDVPLLVVSYERPLVLAVGVVAAVGVVLAAAVTSVAVA